MSAKRAEQQSDVSPMVQAALKLYETLDSLVESLSDNDKREYYGQISKPVISARGGEVFGKVIQLFQTDVQKVWGFPEIQEALQEADQKAIYNTINYLAKTGRLERISRGRYLLKGIGASIETEGAGYGGERATEHDT